MAKPLKAERLLTESSRDIYFRGCNLGSSIIGPVPATSGGSELHCRQQHPQQQESGHAGKEHQRHADSRLAVHFGQQVGCGYIDRHAG